MVESLKTTLSGENLLTIIGFACTIFVAFITAFLTSKNNNKNIKYADFCSILKYFGFVCKRQRGSHRLYYRIGVKELLNIQNVNGEVKPYQIKQFLNIIKKYNLEE